MPTQRAANLFLLGAPKAGTTSIADWLAQHPDVAWSVPKEPYFWAADRPGQRAHYGFDTWEAYARLYAGDRARAARWRGDGSTTYLYSASAVPAILEAEPRARFVVAVRDPASLVVSYHRTQCVALNEDEPDAARAWERSVHGQLPRAATPLDGALVDYPTVGRQGAALARLLALVPAEQVEVVVFDDLVADPAGVLARLLDFLDLPPVAGPLDLTARNTSDKAARFPTLRRLAQHPPARLAPAVRWLRQRSRTSPALRRVKRLGWRAAPRPEPDPALRRRLTAYFAEDVALLERLLGRPVPWGSGGPGTGAAPGSQAQASPLSTPPTTSA